MAVMFVDNSGVDIVLGVFPFARELLSRGTMVNSVYRVSQKKCPLSYFVVLHRYL